MRQTKQIGYKPCGLWITLSSRGQYSPSCCAPRIRSNSIWVSFPLFLYDTNEKDLIVAFCQNIVRLSTF
ncbi:hypothetical protein L6164_028234 [Bauhinia variegata]|uniref:Uncharacterized protein n=1 Tax=Bauhinia variegata TaxID=167791 RepID=A0ACB9LV82_BAUVA|nr:hypothetical protein L6164_028234 [Bauhinia variegata]